MSALSTSIDAGSVGGSIDGISGPNRKNDRANAAFLMTGEHFSEERNRKDFAAKLEAASASLTSFGNVSFALTPDEPELAAA